MFVFGGLETHPTMFLRLVGRNAHPTMLNGGSKTHPTMLRPFAKLARTRIDFDFLTDFHERRHGDFAAAN